MSVLSTSFDITAINTALQHTQFANKLHHFASIDSTNTRALADAQSGIASGQVYIADEQTAGRGRGDHAWHSEPDNGLYLTMLVRPHLRAADALKLSMMTALAVIKAIHQVTASSIIDLRWPNDLVIGNHPARKTGGILTETTSAPTGELRHAAIGIGLNLNQLEFPADLAQVATSLRRELHTPIHRQSLAIALLCAMDEELRSIESTANSALLQRFTAASTWVQGKQVQVAEEGGYTGKTDGLTVEGLLRVQCHDGTQRVVRHGGVRELYERRQAEGEKS